jgi:hypothetical protein
MDILGKARKLESTLARTFDRAAQQWSKSGPRGPLEIMHAILEAVDDRIEPAGRGMRVFPFNRIKVSIAAASRDDRTRFSSVLDEDPPLQERISSRLRESRCDVHGLQVRISYVAAPEPAWIAPEFHVEFSRASHVDPPAEPALVHTLQLTIVTGAAEQPTYTFALDRVYLGRCTELRDKRNRLIRTNHVVFTDGAGSANDTVSRQHAHIEYSAQTGDYRIADDRSAYGTTIVRNGKTIGVPTGSRGVRLQSGDELMLGEARVRVTIEAR